MVLSSSTTIRGDGDADGAFKSLFGRMIDSIGVSIEGITVFDIKGIKGVGVLDVLESRSDHSVDSYRIASRIE